MIYAEKENAREVEFVSLLEKTKYLLSAPINSGSTISPDDFERMVFEKMKEASIGSDFDGTIRQTGKYAFPDIVLDKKYKYFGVEVKVTSGDHWTSIGNSVLETSREKDTERIYIMFGKLGGKPDIKFRLYQQCLPGVSVTHSPRYKIDMNLAIGQSIFDKIGTDYDTLRSNNPIQNIKEYYRSGLKKGDGLWWIDNEEKAISPVIRSFNNLTKPEKESFIVEAMILFPEMFGNDNRTKFERSAAYLISERNVVSASLRDKFTGGGRGIIKINGKKISIPKIAQNMRIRAKEINSTIKEINPERLAYYWNVGKINSNPIKQWLEIVSKNFEDSKTKISISEIFESGLNEAH